MRPTGKTFVPDKGYKDTLAVASKVGNHIGSIDVALEYEFENVILKFYRQNLYDVGAIAHLANIADGINGISLINKNAKTGNGWHKLLFEIVYTKDQAGYKSSKRTASGDEDYYNNFEFSEGWSYKGLNLGNPLLTTRSYLRNDLPAFHGDYFINNRVFALHAGIDATINNVNFISKVTYSRNYGTYATDIVGHSLGNVFFPTSNETGLFGKVDQLSGYIEANKKIKHDITIGAALAGDIGGLYYNSAGIILKLKKTLIKVFRKNMMHQRACFLSRSLLNMIARFMITNVNIVTNVITFVCFTANIRGAY